MTDLLDLEPVPEILSHECTLQLDTERLYKYLPTILTPFLLSKLKDQDSCFSQVIRLCMIDDVSVDICSGYQDIFNRCPIASYRFILYLIDLNFIRDGRMAGRHSEAVLVDSLFGTVEFFEPNGPVASWYPLISSFIENKFKSIFPTYKFLSTSEFCPIFGPQSVTGLAACGAFSILFLLLRVFNDLTSGEIIGTLVNLPRSELTLLMNKFICYVVDYDLQHNLTAFQNLYDRTSEKIFNVPELNTQLDRIYYNLDMNELQQFIQLYGL